MESGGQFDESFYATSAQVLPVLLLTVVFQLRMGRRHPDEPLGVSLWVIGMILAMTIGELAAFTALADQENLSALGNAPIWAALVWGFMSVAVRAILPRWEATHAAIPLSLSLAIRYTLLILIVVVASLATFGVVDQDALLILAVGIIFVVVLAAMLTTDITEWRQRKGVRPNSSDQNDEAVDLVHENPEHDETTGH